VPTEQLVDIEPGNHHLLQSLGQADDIEEKAVRPHFLVRNWSPAFKERDAGRPGGIHFFASPQCPPC
jgi:hypothetical protein